MINQFVTSNWYLFAALIAILGLLAFDPIRRRSSGIRPVSAIQLPQLMNHDNAVIVDVRDNTDFENSHIAKAINIPINQLKLNLARLEKYLPHKPISALLPCGQRLWEPSSWPGHRLRQCISLEMETNAFSDR